jgi:hypothetical protein
MKDGTIWIWGPKGLPLRPRFSNPNDYLSNWISVSYREGHLYRHEGTRGFEVFLYGINVKARCHGDSLRAGKSRWQ